MSSRLTIDEHDNKINTVLIDFTIKPKKVVAGDIDSFIYFVLYSGKDELGNKNPEYEEKDLPELYGKLDELMLKMLNNIEEYFTIEKLYLFIRGKNNFRKELYPLYKANRPEKNPLSILLYQYLIDKYQAVEADGYEAEDYVYTVAKELGEGCIVAYCDHDLHETPLSILYNYQKNTWTKFTEKEAKWNLYKKYVIGEPGDNVNLCVKTGIKFFEKTFHIDMTDEEYEEALLVCFMKAYKGNEELATLNLNLTKQLLGLKIVNK